MARPLRIEYAGALYHVTSRGDGREAIYLEDNDRELFLGVLGEVCEQFNWAIHAWCEMTNHYHLLVETPDGNLSKGMRHLNGVYTQRFNRKHQRVGHVFQGRFKAILVDKESYLLELARYIVLNPVRAGMVESAEHWRWSSYRLTAGLDAVPAWFDSDWLLGAFSPKRSTAIRKYMEFVANGVQQPSPWQYLKQQVFLGDDDFVARSLKKASGRRLSEVPRIQRRAKPKTLDEYSAEAPDRNQAMYDAYRGGGYTLSEIGDYFGLHYSTVSLAVKSRSKLKT
jgi:REP element-mobilizing transposase RayT